MSTLRSRSGNLEADNLSQHALSACCIQWATAIKNPTLENRTRKLKIDKINQQFKMLSLFDTIHSTKKEPTLRELLDEAKELNERDAIYGYRSDEDTNKEEVEAEKVKKVKITVKEVHEEVFVDVSLSSGEREKAEEEEEEEEWSFIKHEEGEEDWSLVEPEEVIPEKDEAFPF